MSAANQDFMLGLSNSWGSRSNPATSAGSTQDSFECEYRARANNQTDFC